VVVLGHDDADTHLGGSGQAADQERAVEGTDEALGQRNALGLLDQALGDDRELVALQAGDGVAGSDDVDQAAGDGLEELARAVLAERGAVKVDGEGEDGY
jgi:hypothetical protein